MFAQIRIRVLAGLVVLLLVLAGSVFFSRNASLFPDVFAEFAVHRELAAIRNQFGPGRL